MKTQRLTLCSLALGVLLLAGCNPETPPATTDTNTMTTTHSSAAPATAPGTAASSSSTTSIDAANGTTVGITIDDSSIKMPSALPAGTLSFTINNAGKKKHALEIKGGDFDQKQGDVDAGASQTLTVNLKAGTYDVTDPDTPTIKATLEVK